MYINNLYVNEDIMPVTSVTVNLSHFGLTSRIPEQPKNEAQILGLTVWCGRQHSALKAQQCAH